MSYQVFLKFAAQLGLPKEDTPFIFRAADISNRWGLSFRDLMYVIAALEPTTSHGGGSAEVRCRYIFRFFDRDEDNMLNKAEFNNFIAAIRVSKNQPSDPKSVNAEAEACLKTLNLSTPNLSITDFLRAVGDLKVRGTSQIFRSPASVMGYLQKVQEREIAAFKFLNAKRQGNKQMQPVLDMDTKNFQNTTPKRIEYQIGVHTVRLQKSGTMISINQIYEVNAAMSVSSTEQKTLNSIGAKTSQDQFSQTSLTNEILKGVRYLSQINNIRGPKGKSAYNWGQLNAAQFAKNFINICLQVKEQFKAEPRMLQIQSPVYIMGDLHGNFHSLLYFEKVLWHLGPTLCPCNLVFLGDYVDRGDYGIEVIAYLFCYKLHTPTKLIMLRGNHEIRVIQKLFTFYTECVNKFGEKVGNEVWNAVNAVFDLMPIAAVVDGK